MRFPHKLLLGALLTAPIAIVAAPGIARAEEAGDEIVRDLNSKLSRGSMYAERQHFDADRCAETVKDVEAGLAKLKAANPAHSRLADLTQKLAEFKKTVAEMAVGEVKESFDRELQFFGRNLEQFEQNEQDSDANFITKASENCKRMQKLLDDAKGTVESDAGKEWGAEAKKTLAECKAKVAADGVIAELRRLVYERDDSLQTGLKDAVEYVPKLLDDGDSEKAAKYWTAAKKLVKAIEKPRYKDLQLCKDMLARFAEVKERYEKEMPAILAAQKIGPLVEHAKSVLEGLSSAIDNKNLESAGEARKRVLEATRELRTFTTNDDAKSCVAECDAALARCDQELGDSLAKAELSDIEVKTKAVCDTAVRGIDKKDSAKATSAAKKLRGMLDLLVPYGASEKAKTIEARIQGTLARVDAAFKGAPQAPADDEVPQFEVDFNADAEVQQKLGEINGTYGRYKDDNVEVLMAIESIQLAEGMGDSQTHMIFDTVTHKTQYMIENARQADKQGKELAKLDAKNAAIAVIKDWTPKLVKRAQALKDEAGKKCDYANAIAACVSMLDDASSYRHNALEDGPRAARDNWPRVLEHMEDAKKKLAPAFKLLPDEHAEADVFAARIDEWKKEAEKLMTEVCVAEAQKLAIAGQMDEAKEYASALKKALPASKANDELAKSLSGAGEARLKCEAEIREREALLQKRAIEAAQAFEPKYAEWKGKQGCSSIASFKILADLGSYKGKKVAGTYQSLGESTSGDYFEIDGETWWVDYDPDVQAKLAAQKKKLDDTFAAIVEACKKKYGLSEIFVSTAHYYDDCDFVVEITGSSSYTPRHTVRDSSGSYVGSIDGTPYPVPAGVIRGIKTKYYVIVPGAGSSLDTMKMDGIMP